jgi:hypothetical protein
VLATLGRQICASGLTAAARDPGSCTVQIQAHAGFFFFLFILMDLWRRVKATVSVNHAFTKALPAS